MYFLDVVIYLTHSRHQSSTTGVVKQADFLRIIRIAGIGKGDTDPIEA
jgi:hypothetical protein